MGTVLESDGRVEVETVAETVADGSLSVEEVTTGLVHNHLPRLGEAGLIRHDRGSNHLEATETTGRAGGLIRIAVPSD